MDCNIYYQPRTCPLSLVVVNDAPSKDQIDRQFERHQPHHRRSSSSGMGMRQSSSSSCISSSLSYASNVSGSSIKSHRRTKIEVSSFLFGPITPTSSGPRGYSEYDSTEQQPGCYDWARQASRVDCNHSICTTCSYYERRGPVSDRVVSTSCCSGSSRVSVDDTWGSSATATADVSFNSKQQLLERQYHQGRRDISVSTGSHKINEKHQVGALNPACAAELIRELSFSSFDVGVPPKTPLSAPQSTTCPEKLTSSIASVHSDQLPYEVPNENGPIINVNNKRLSNGVPYDDVAYAREEPIEGETMEALGALLSGSDNDDDDYSAREEPVELKMEEALEPPSALRPMSPPLPPRVNRVVSLTYKDVPCQIYHNRNRARSTSLSEMSESYVKEFVLGNDEEDMSFASSPSHCSSSSNREEECSAIEKATLRTIDNNVIVSPSRTMAQSPGVSQLSRARSLTMGSEQSSYFSSTSSSSAGLTTISSSESPRLHYADDDKEEGNLLVEPNFDQVLMTGHSLQEGVCNAYHCDSSAEPSEKKVQARPRLNSETLREWNAICEEEFFKKGITRDQFIFRVISCPNNMNATALPERRGSVSKLDLQDEDEIFEPITPDAPHLMAEHLSHAVSHSLFSYTNSCAASTISSHKKDLEEIISDLDFDMGVMISYSIENKSFVDAPLDGGGGADPRPKKKIHRKSLSTGSRLGKSLYGGTKTIIHQEDDGTSCTTAKHRHRRFNSEGSIFCNSQVILSEVNLNFADEPSLKIKYNAACHHRRSLSTGSCLGKSTVGVPNTIVHQEDNGPQSKAMKHRHRRFKSEGSIVCNSQTIISEVNINFTHTLSVKSKFNAARHLCSKSLGTLRGSEIFDSSFLQCILEEGSKGCDSGDELLARVLA